MLLLACVLSLGGWVVVAPALRGTGRDVVEPPADLSSSEAAPTRRAGAAAPAASAMPAVAGAARAFVPQAVDARAAETTDARCGEDQLPVYRPAERDADGAIHVEAPVPDPDGIVRRLPGEIKSAGVGYTGAMSRLDAALRSSGDPFDRAMADWLDLDLIEPPVRRQEALVRDAVATSDARVYGLAYAACNVPAVVPDAPPACAELSPDVWAQLDPGNAKPWLYALQRADAAGDVAAGRVALDRLAGSTRLDVRFHAGAAAVARQRLGDADLAAQSMTVARALGMPQPPFQALTARCRDGAGGDPALAATCARIADVFYEHSDTYMGRAIGASLHKIATGDAGWLDRVHQEQRERRGPDAVAPGNAPCAGQRAFLALFVRLDEVGETHLARQAASAPRP